MLPTVSPTDGADIDLASAGWFDWLWPADSETATLYVGRLDGRMFKVIDSGVPIDSRAASTGPVHGLVVTSWANAKNQTSIDLVDTADGTLTNVATFDGSFNLGAIDPNGAYVYWDTIEGGKISGLWRQPVSGGSAEEVLAGADVAGPIINFSLDGKYVVLSGRHGDTGGWDYSVFDADFKPVAHLLDGRYGQVVGFLEDDRLVVYPPGSDNMPPTVALLAVDFHDWTAKEIVSIEVELRATIIPAADGTARLVFEGSDAQGRYTLNVLDPDGSARLLFVGGGPSDNPANALVFSPTSQNVEAPGWVALFPQGQAMAQAALTGGDQGLRRLIRIADGEAVQIPSLSFKP